MCFGYVVCFILNYYRFGVIVPDMPRNFQVVSWNVTSITVGWDCPDNNRFSLFLVTAFYLNGSDYILEERYFRHTLKSFVFTLLDLQPCSRGKIGLQTVCEFDTASHFSRRVLIEGNTGEKRGKKRH